MQYWSVENRAPIARSTTRKSDVARVMSGGVM